MPPEDTSGGYHRLIVKREFLFILVDVGGDASQNSVNVPAFSCASHFIALSYVTKSLLLFESYELVKF